MYVYVYVYVHLHVLWLHVQYKELDPCLFATKSALLNKHNFSQAWQLSELSAKIDNLS